MTDYLLLIVADLLLAVNFAINKIYQKRAGTSFKAGFVFSAMTGLFTSVIFFLYNGFTGGFRFSVSAVSVIFAILLSLLGTSYSLIGFRIMKRRGMSLYTLFLMTGGMTVPYLFGLIFLDEKFSVLRTIGLIVIIAGVFFSGFGKEKPDRISIILCVIVFFLNGGVSVVSKLHSINAMAVPPEEFVVLSSLIGFATNLILMFTVKDPPEKKPKKEPFSLRLCVNLFALPAISAVVGGISSVLQLTGAETIDASLLYPFITGGSIVFSTLTGWLIFKEKLSKNMILSIILAFIGTLFFLNFKEIL